MIYTDRILNMLVFEGPDRSGKSTQCTLLIDRLKSMGFKVAFLKFPSESWAGRLARRWLKSGTAVKYPNLFQVVNTIDKLSMSKTIKKLSVENDFIIVDRWKLSSIVYGTATGCWEFVINIADRFLTDAGGTYVFLGTSYFDPVLDTYDSDVQLQSRVKELYQQSHIIDPSNVVINNKKSLIEVHNCVWNHAFIMIKIVEVLKTKEKKNVGR